MSLVWGRRNPTNFPSLLCSLASTLLGGFFRAMMYHQACCFCFLLFLSPGRWRRHSRGVLGAFPSSSLLVFLVHTSKRVQDLSLDELTKMILSTVVCVCLSTTYVSHYDDQKLHELQYIDVDVDAAAIAPNETIRSHDILPSSLPFSFERVRWSPRTTDALWLGL